VAFANRPLYLQVRDALAERIASGDLLPGSAIPSEGELAREVGVSAGTVRKALQLMEEERLIWRRQGRGTFVRDPCSRELAQRFIRLYGPDGNPICGQIESTATARGAANAIERDRLRLAAGAEVYRIHRVRHHGGAPFSVEHSTLPADLFPDLGENGPIADPIGALAQEYRMLLGSAQERVSSAVPPEAIGKALLTAPGEQVVVLDRIVFTIDDRRPVEWRVAHSHVTGSYYLAEIR
jgi:GntR family transcriptional regulator